MFEGTFPMYWVQRRKQIFYSLSYLVFRLVYCFKNLVIFYDFLTTDGWCPQLQLTLITARQRIRSVSMPLLLCHRCSFLFWLAQHKFIGYFFVQKKMKVIHVKKDCNIALFSFYPVFPAGILQPPCYKNGYPQ